jgi:hypothetical protein
VKLGGPPALLLALLTLAPVVAIGGACKGSAPASTPEAVIALPAQDYSDDAGVAFDANEVVPSAAFTDFASLAASDVQNFLEHDPYTGQSFLCTYQSHGLLFSGAVAQAAQLYRINPIVLLVAVEAAGGLVADTAYPVGTVNVEYLFGCGCPLSSDASTCDPATAGLDVQLECYADALRTSLDQVAVNGQTAGGWGPGITTTSLDGIAVTPADDSTSALYQYDPVVGTGKSGSSLFENIWLEFTTAFSYQPPTGTGSGATALVGDPCVSANDCAVQGAICATGAKYPGGMCTSQCTGACEATDAFCADFTAGGFCLALCNTTVPASCRSGYTCTLVQPSGAPPGTPPANVCTPM